MSRKSATPADRRERPILFSAPMVRAILAGTKTVTRRVVKNLRIRTRGVISGDWPFDATTIRGTLCAGLNPQGAVFAKLTDGTTLGLKPGEFDFVCPYVIGETRLVDFGKDRKAWTIAPRESRLWVRESFAPFNAAGSRCKPVESMYVVLGDGTQIAKDGRRTEPCTEYAKDAFDGIKWRPGIFMPRWASRITLEIVDVRIERLHEITEEDAKAEGVAPYEFSRRLYPSKLAAEAATLSYREGFHAAWDRLNGKRAPWASNPWVWRIEFERVESA